MLFTNTKKKTFPKHALALVATAAAGATLWPATSFGQSSVTLYGIADVGVEYLNNTTAGGTQTRMVSGNLSGSRWGLKGVEDMGSGLKAIFVLEDGFNINDGTTAQSTRGLGANATTTARLFGRQAWVGLSYKGQQLTFGRHMSLLFEQATQFDPFGAALRYSTLTLDSAFSARVDNSARYSGSFGPVTASAMYSTRYDIGYGTEVPGAELTGRYFGGILNYATGPFAASVLYEQRNSNTAATNTATERRATAAATYQFGSLKGLAGYRYLRASNAFQPVNPIAVANGAEASAANMYWLGAQHYVTPAFAMTVSGYYQDVHSSDADPWMAVLGLDYFLSKRTDLYATAAFTRNKGGSNLGIVGYGTAATNHNQAAVVLGMRQKF
ncbi:porin [Caballeronia sp. LP006]|uniref:porin n=1 Tax=Caballeronia sp. LP006 TaxID=3038552 RepID=UPI002864CB40|nr:porin [Caballeronia sp. LP006]MDR5826273.1 porin [Caballeronia sp. LP006]